MFRRTPPKPCRPQLPEALEPRALFAAGGPSPAAQLFLELVNRARANPALEAARYGIDLNEGLAPGALTSAARQPLAFDAALLAAASRHAEDLLDHDRFSHDGSDGSTPASRLADAGYAAAAWKENLAWSGRATYQPAAAELAAELHRRLFVDEGVAGRGHRLNLLDASMSQAGIALAAGPYQEFNSVLVAHELARPSAPVTLLTGVAYTDAVVADAFYTVGEGLGGIAVTATRLSDGAVFSTTTWDSGGYSLVLPAGQYAVNRSGGSLPAASPVAITVADRNVKLDFRGPAGASTQPPPAGPTDVKAPRASIEHYKRYRRSSQLRIVYRDAGGIDRDSISTGDVRVTDLRGFTRSARLVAVHLNPGGTRATATYRLRAPGGQWDRADNGVYSVRLQGRQVQDEAGNSARRRILGSFVTQLRRRIAGATVIPGRAASPIPSPAPSAIDDLLAPHTARGVL